jgi:hypothetical protein
MSGAIIIPRRLNGPPDSGHGGYSCGRVAAFLDGVVEVSLRSPPPLERPLRVDRDDGHVSAHDGDRLVAEGRQAGLDLDVPDPVSIQRAEEGNREGHRRTAGVHPFPTCLVCGPERDGSDGFGVIAGPVGDGRFAADWTPADWIADERGLVRPEFVWAALDCPSSFPVANESGDPPCVLARLTASLERPVEAGRPHAIVSWPLEVDGRKRHSGVALFDAGGELLARARALWIELRR